MDEKVVSSAEEKRSPAQVEEVENIPQNQNSKKQKFWSLTKKLSKRWFIDAFTGMAQGLFVTLIAGTIFTTLGQYVFTENNAIGRLLVLAGRVASLLMGAGIGAGIAYRLKMPPLVVLSAIVAGFVGAWADVFITAGGEAGVALNLVRGLVSDAAVTKPGNPIGAYVTALLACEISGLTAGKTKLDIIVIPIVSICVMIIGAYISYPFIWLISMLGKGIAYATAFTPFIMGIVVAVIMGVLLTLPTSSAAIWVAIAAPIIASGDSAQINAMYIAGGAATVGCACQMVGFAVMSFKENGWGGLISQGIGTSMLQIPNVMKNPRILLPPIFASIICGPLSTCAFKLLCGASGGGMGTCGFVGIIDIVTTTKANGGNIALMIFGVILLMVILPALLSWLFCLLLRKVNWIKPGDLKLPD
ncbi:MAG: PTS sugar transporter subunit IIC [Clostridia bacterium]|nr:PTS sugar transporter subunit IIC [Clostridia bacterium]MDE7328164.1 PTS sugar transporter subunit IIC [Clostridia bacterium]